MISGVSASISLAFTQISGTPNTIYGGGVVGPAHQDNRLRPGIHFIAIFGPRIPLRFNISPPIRC